MPASQLKRLKASLREQGISGPQKSKKQKKALQGSKGAHDRVQRNVALQQIRESFNPFEFRATNSRPEKFASVSHKSANGSGSGKFREVLHRPGVSKSHGEEVRRATLLPELQRRNKVGGLVDRRIGEGDMDMTPEERAIQRFARERERKKKGASLFDLEASDDDGAAFSGRLTHGGHDIDGLAADDFDDDVSKGSDTDQDELFQRKRRHSNADEGMEGPVDDVDDQQPERKKTKKEVMEEVIAKSKMHKYERQKAKEDDDDLREELDSGFNDVLALLKGVKKTLPPPSQPAGTPSSAPSINPDRQKLLDGLDREKADKEYDVRLKQLAQDTRAKPSERTKTAEESAAAEAEKLRLLEEKRMKRMHGEDTSDNEDAAAHTMAAENVLNGDDDIPDQAVDFGFTSSLPQTKNQGQSLVLDEEDEFDLDEDLVASGSDAGLSDIELDSDSESDEPDVDEETAEQRRLQDEEDEFVEDILGADVIAASTRSKPATGDTSPGTDLAYTYPCPRTHEALLDITNELDPEQLPTVIQRIRALYHPSLSASNKESMADFSRVLVEHIYFLGLKGYPLAVTEQVIRHLHSLSRTYALEIGGAFRKSLEAFDVHGGLTPGDLVVLTAIGSIYPTSDHWHQVVTPANVIMARWLSLHLPSRKSDKDSKSLLHGAYLVALSISYQKLSRRYLPEALRYTLGALAVKTVDANLRTLHASNLLQMAEAWSEKSAFIEIFTPAITLLKAHKMTKELHRLEILLQQARLRRRPLELHHHKPLAIKTIVPKFEESFNPDKHYDPDKERSDAKKLQKEYKRERKGALRELRKDANFIAREQLREKKSRDEEYEKKYRRLVAEVQGEEGHQKKEYEREKRLRTKKR